MDKKRRKKPLTKKQYRKKRIRFIIRLSLRLLFLITLLCLSCSFVLHLLETLGVINKVRMVGPVKVTQMYLTPNEYSRPQVKLKKVKGIVVHYTANPGTDAKANRNYFENLSKTKTTKASSHYIIGLDGSIIQCIPLKEIAYASNERNEDTISIEVCHPDESGKFNKKTYQSLVELVAFLCGTFNIKEEGIIRHYDITGKLCPLYYVEHEEEWDKFKHDVLNYIDQYGK